MEPDYPSNSINGPKKTQAQQQTPEKNLQKVVTGKVVHRKKPLGRRMRESFFEGEDTRTAVTQVLKDMFIPDTKGMVLDVINGILERKMYGDYGGYSRRGGRGPMMGGFGGPTIIGGPGGYTAYNRMSGHPGQRDPMAGPSSPSQQRPGGNRRRDSREIGEFIVESRSEGIEIINRLSELIAVYQVVTVADLLQLLGADPNPIDARWGWFDLSAADVHRVQGAYLLVLPRPEPID